MEGRTFVVEPNAADMELVEAGQSENNFVWAVGTVVDIHEEGLFRHIIAYL